MSIFEKIPLEPIEPVPSEERAAPSRQWRDETLTVTYGAGRRILLVFVAALLLPIAFAFLEAGFFAFEVVVVASVAWAFWYIAGSLATREITFAPDKVVLRTWFGGRIELCPDTLVLTANEQHIIFYHGSKKNLREGVKIRRALVEVQESTDILAYAERVYGVVPGATGGPTGVEAKTPRRMGHQEFEKSVDSYRIMGAFFVVMALIAMFTVGLSESFYGFSRVLPSFPVRLLCIAFAAGAFFILRRFGATSVIGHPSAHDLVTSRLKKLESNAFTCATIAVAVAGLGLVLFLLFGNTLDLYIFLLVGVFYFFDYYPRLSAWEQTVRPADKAARGADDRPLLPRRSLQVSLVLMGALAVMSYGENTHYLYSSRKDCMDDWGDGKDCREVPAGSSRYGARFYGPRYGSETGRATHSLGVARISRGGFGSLGSFHASFGG